MGVVASIGVLLLTVCCLLGVACVFAADVDDDDFGDEGVSSHSDKRPVLPSLSLPLPESLLCIRW